MLLILINLYTHFHISSSLQAFFLFTEVAIEKLFGRFLGLKSRNSTLALEF